MHVAEKIARAASAQLIRCADADDAPRVAIDGIAQKAVFLLERVYAALTENGQACIVFFLRRDAPGSYPFLQPQYLSASKKLPKHEKV